MKSFFNNALVCGLLLFLIPGSVSAQLAWSSGNHILTGYTGFCTGYIKEPGQQVAYKNFVRVTCSGLYSIANPWTPVPNTTNFASSGMWGWVIRVNNIDSSMMFSNYNFNPPQHQVHLTEKNCIQCYTTSEVSNGIPLRFRNEFVTSANYFVSRTVHSPTIYYVPLNENSFTIYHGLTDVFSDSMSYVLKNVLPLGGRLYSPDTNYRQEAHYYSRIYRYNDYQNISSPDFTNKASIIAVKNKPATYNPGIVDAENDSIRVTPLHVKINKDGVWFHPNYRPVTGGLPSNLHYPAWIETWAKKAMNDSVMNVQYYPGYSPSNPFGPGSSYSLDPNTGEISFTAVDTGIYVLTYRVEEYRDGQLLGDIMNVRIAYVIDSNTEMINVAGPYNVTGGTYNAAANVIAVCPGQPVSLNMKATTILNNAQIVMTDNMLSQIPASTISYTGQGTDSVTLSFSWTPTLADTGYHYLYVDAVDTFCGQGHLNAHQSKGFKIYVPPPTGFHTDTAICEGSPITLNGAFAGPYQWSVLPGGDPNLPCTNCGSITVSPNVTTTYTLHGSGAFCNRRDTVTVKVHEDFTINAGKDSLICGPMPTGFAAGASVTPAGGYTYQWSPATDVSNANILNPILMTTPQTYTLTVNDTAGCFSHTDTVTLSNFIMATSVSSATDTVCPGGKVQLNATGGTKYFWQPVTGLNCNTCPDPVASPTATTNYDVRITDTATGCYEDRQLVIFVNQTPIGASVVPAVDTFCPGEAVQLSAIGGNKYSWQPPNGLTCDTCPDPLAQPANSITYYVRITDTASACYEDKVVKLVKSDISLSVNAGGNIDAPGGAFQLNGYAPGTFYWSPGKYLEDSTKARTKGQISENTMFVLTANEGGCTATDTITVFMLRCQKIILPNVFSPNGDGRNDRFIFNNTEPLEVLEFSIYNRWGAKVYSETGTSIEGWDGTYKGSPAPTEVYVYRLRLRCDGKEEILQGNVTLLR